MKRKQCRASAPTENCLAKKMRGCPDNVVTATPASEKTAAVSTKWHTLKANVLIGEGTHAKRTAPRHATPSLSSLRTPCITNPMWAVCTHTLNGDVKNGQKLEAQDHQECPEPIAPHPTAI